MADYGIKIAKRNHDISDGERYLIMNTKYPVLKLKLSGEGTIQYVAETSQVIVEITHSLGYVPLCFVSGEGFNVSTNTVDHIYSDWNRWIYTGPDIVGVADFYYYYADTTKLYIVFKPSVGITDQYTFNLGYMYHIFYDEDTL